MPTALERVLKLAAKGGWSDAARAAAAEARRRKHPAQAEQTKGRRPAAAKPATKGRGAGSHDRPAVRADDARHSQGQTKSNFTHPVTGHTMGKTEVGDTFEQMFAAKGAHLVEGKFGCCYKMIAGAGSGTSRTTALDFSLKNHGGELKTLNARAANQKTAIKKEEVARKNKAVGEAGLRPLLLVQVVDQDSGQVHVFAHQAFESKAVARMEHLGTYKYTPKDFEKAQRAAGHWDKAAGRAAEQRAKSGSSA